MLQLTDLQMDLIAICKSTPADKEGCCRSLILAQPDPQSDGAELAAAIEDTLSQALTLVNEGILIDVSSQHEESLRRISQNCNRKVRSFTFTKLGKDMFDNGKSAGTSAPIN